MELAPTPERPVGSYAEHPTEPGEHKYEILNSPELRAKYLNLTDALVQEMVQQGTDTAVFLDKSARPVAWMVNELWDTLSPQDDDGNPLFRRPDIKFVNIDREQWGAVIGRSETKDGGLINIDLLPQDRLNELQSVFGPLKESDKETSLLTGKKVMVVDEVRVSGDTANMAEKILQKAFPDAEEIKKTYWMSGQVKRQRSGVSINTQLPVWYSDRESTGRLVADRDTTKSNRSKSSRQRIGRFWLSTAFREPDQKGLQLKQEVKWLIEDLKNHKVLYMPAIGWDKAGESTERRIARIDGISKQDYVKLRQEFPDNRDFVSAYTSFMEDQSK